MDPASLTEWLELLAKLGIGFTAGCVLFIWALWKGLLHWDVELKACEKERAEWKHAALSGTGVLEKLTGLVERIEQRRL